MYSLFKAGFGYMEKDCHDYEDKLFDLSNLLYFMNMIYLPFIDFRCSETCKRWKVLDLTKWLGQAFTTTIMISRPSRECHQSGIMVSLWDDSF